MTKTPQRDKPDARLTNWKRTEAPGHLAELTCSAWPNLQIVHNYEINAWQIKLSGIVLFESWKWLTIKESAAATIEMLKAFLRSTRHETINTYPMSEEAARDRMDEIQTRCGASDKTAKTHFRINPIQTSKK